MKPVRLEMTDFSSYKHAVVPFDEVSLAGIVGPNGCGKSSILLGMRTALFGRQVGSLDELVRLGASSFKLVFDFVVGNVQYRVVREQKNTQKASLSEWRNSGWEPVTDVKVSDVDAKIVEILGCGYAEFTMAHHLPQGEMGKFAALDAAQRKTWLMDNLPMGAWPRLEVVAKSRAKEYAEALVRNEAQRIALAPSDTDFDAVVSVAQGERDVLNERLALTTAHVDAAAESNEKGRALARDLEVAAGDLRAKQHEHGRITSSIEAASRRCESLQAALRLEPEPAEVDVDSLHAEVAALEAEERAAAEARTAFERAKAAYESAAGVRSAAGKALEVAGEALVAVQGDTAPVCPTCQQALLDGAGAVVEAKFLAAFDAGKEQLRSAHANLEARAAEAEAASLKAEMAARAYDRDRHARAKAEIVEASAVQKRIAERAGAVKEVEMLLAKISVDRDELEVVSADLLPIEGRYREAQAAMDSAPEVVDMDAAKRSLSAIRNEITVVERRMERALAERDAAAAAEQKVKALEAEHADISHRLHLTDLLVKAYGKSGIPARILAGAVLDIETWANSFLEQFTDGLSVQFETQRENKTGGMKETLDILVTDSSGTRSISRYSGGERTRINFALSVALSQFVAQHSGVVVSSFAVDEPEFLDADGLRELTSCLHILSRSVPLVLLISHYGVDLPQNIIVTKGPNGSEVKVA